MLELKSILQCVAPLLCGGWCECSAIIFGILFPCSTAAHFIARFVLDCSTGCKVICAFRPVTVLCSKTTYIFHNQQFNKTTPPPGHLATVWRVTCCVRETVFCFCPKFSYPGPRYSGSYCHDVCTRGFHSGHTVLALEDIWCAYFSLDMSSPHAARQCPPPHSVGSALPLLLRYATASPGVTAPSIPHPVSYATRSSAETSTGLLVRYTLPFIITRHGKTDRWNRTVYWTRICCLLFLRGAVAPHRNTSA
jgi:hypothetical protein